MSSGGECKKIGLIFTTHIDRGAWHTLNGFYPYTIQKQKSYQYFMAQCYENILQLPI
jgi:hypothetical protein